MIPNYLVVNDLHMLDTYWSLWLPIAISAYNMVIMKNFFQGLPDSIEESAQIDGCNDLQVFLRIVVPISKASFATITLFYAVSHWNSYFNAMMYLNDINELAHSGMAAADHRIIRGRFRRLREPIRVCEGTVRRGQIRGHLCQYYSHRHRVSFPAEILCERSPGWGR